jgi:hypothetical protein
VSSDGTLLGLPVQGRDGVVHVLTSLMLYPQAWRRTPYLILSTPESDGRGIWSWP